MAKAASPIRLQADLMQVAESTAKRFHRSTAEQIEYWADLGRAVSSTLDPDVLLSVTAGLTVLRTEAVFCPSVDPDGVFKSLENDRESGELCNAVSNSSIRYQVSKNHPGFLEKIDSNGDITTGQFKDGLFIALNESGR